MRRRLLKLAVFVVLGAVVNVAVAWGCALWSPFDSEAAVEETTLEEVYSLFPQADNLHSVTELVGFGVSCDRFSVRSEFSEIDWGRFYLMICIYRSGWPLEALRCHGSVANDRPFSMRWQHGINVSNAIGGPWAHLPPYTRPIPLSPLFPGFALNSLFYAALLWIGFMGLSKTRSLHRRRRGRCAQCGYDLRGGEHERCPECGAGS